jgi:hypothetical protein
MQNPATESVLREFTVLSGDDHLVAYRTLQHTLGHRIFDVTAPNGLNATIACACATHKHRRRILGRPQS